MSSSASSRTGTVGNEAVLVAQSVESNRVVDVIVVGAGISGLNAAKWLTESGVNDVVVLEARNRVGGRTFTVNQDEFGWVDMGGSYVTPKQTFIMDLVRELGIETFPVYDDGKCVLISQGRRNVYETQWPTFDWSDERAASANELVDLLNLMDDMLKEIPKDAPWNCAKANEWDNITLQEFFNRHCKSTAGQEFLAAFCKSNVSANPAQVSLLWYLWYTKSTGGNSMIWNVTGGGQELKLCGGTMQISEKIVARLGADKLKLNKAVYNVDQKGGIVTVRALDGTSYKSRYVIMASPLPLLHMIHYDPPLPPCKSALIQRVSMGSTIKCEIYYDTPFWRDKGLSGIVTCGDGIDVINNSIDDCKPDSKYGQLTCFVACEEALKMQKLDHEGRCQLVARCLAKAFDTEEALNPVHYTDKNWCCEQYTGGCYTATYPTGVMSKYGRHLREPFGLIHFAGTETATDWSGYMNGAAQAGERAAKEVLTKLGMLKHGIHVKSTAKLEREAMLLLAPVVNNEDGARIQRSLQAMKPSELEHRL